MGINIIEQNNGEQLFEYKIQKFVSEGNEGIGDKEEDFEILQVIGAGAFSQVLKVKSKKNNFNNQITRLKEDFDRKIKQAELNTTDNEEKQKEAERKYITIKAEFDKEKALLDQKVEHLTRQIEDYSKREKE